MCGKDGAGDSGEMPMNYPLFEKQMLELELTLKRKCDEKSVVEIIQEKMTPSWVDVVKNMPLPLDKRKSGELNIVLFGIEEDNLDNREERQQKTEKSEIS